MTKLSDYVFRFLKEKGASHVFMLPGGGAMHLVDSLGNSGLEYVCCLHEQAASIAAEAYGQHTNKPGIILTTSGPGATNAITGVTAAWIDSTPMIVISGQAKRQDLVGNTGVRQIGSQEVQIIDMVRPITKYAVQVMEPEEIRYHMERAYEEATTGRPGPTWLSIPLDVQATMLEEKSLRGFEHHTVQEWNVSEDVGKTVSLLREAERPLLFAGNGIKLADATQEFLCFARDMRIPVLTTWKMADLMDEDDWLYLGHPGSMGDRGANLVLQQADLLISIGSRIDTSLTAFNEQNFGKEAKKVIVDIDERELARMNLRDMVVRSACDAGVFVRSLREECGKRDWRRQVDRWEGWIRDSHAIRGRYPTVTEAHRAVEGVVSAYYFIEVLCRNLAADDVIVPESSGGAGEITYQAFKIKHGQKMRNAAGLGSMGFGLPYAIGSCLANDGRRTILIDGDGAFQMNIQELETAVRLQLPIKIFIWDNGGYASIRAMQKNSFGGHYVASGEGSGLELPDIAKVANAYGIPSFVARSNTEMEEVVPRVLQMPGIVLCELFISPDETVSPRTKSYQLPDGSMKSSLLEEMWPLLEE